MRHITSLPRVYTLFSIRRRNNLSTHSLTPPLQAVRERAIRGTDVDPEAPLFLVWRLTRVWGDQPRASEAGAVQFASQAPEPATPQAGVAPSDSESSVYFTVVDFPTPPEQDAKATQALRGHVLALEQVLQAMRQGAPIVPYRLSPFTEMLGRFLPPHESKVALLLALARENRSNRPFPGSLQAMKNFGYMCGQHVTCVDRPLQYTPTPPPNFRPRDSGPAWAASYTSPGGSRLARSSFTGSAARAPSPGPAARSATPPRVQPRPRSLSAAPCRPVHLAASGVASARREAGLRQRREIEARQERMRSFSRPASQLGDASSSPGPSRRRDEGPSPSRPFMSPTLNQVSRVRENSETLQSIRTKAERDRVIAGGWRNSPSSAGAFSPAHQPTQTRDGPPINAAALAALDQPVEWEPRRKAATPDRSRPVSTTGSTVRSSLANRPSWNGSRSAPRAVSAPRRSEPVPGPPADAVRASTPSRPASRAARAPSWTEGRESGSPARTRPRPPPSTQWSNSPQVSKSAARTDNWTAPSPGQDDLSMQAQGSARASLQRKSTKSQYAFVRSSGYGRATSPSPSPSRSIPYHEFSPSKPTAKVAPLPMAGWAASPSRDAPSTDQSPRDIALSHPAYREARQPIDPESSPEIAASPPPAGKVRPRPLARLPSGPVPAPSADTRDTGSPSFGSASGPSGSPPMGARSVNSKRNVVSFPVLSRDREDEFSFPVVDRPAGGEMEASFSRASASPTSPEPVYIALSRTQPRIFEGGDASLNAAIADGGSASPRRISEGEVRPAPMPLPLPLPMSESNSPSESMNGGLFGPAGSAFSPTKPSGKGAFGDDSLALSSAAPSPPVRAPVARSLPMRDVPPAPPRPSPPKLHLDLSKVIQVREAEEKNQTRQKLASIKAALAEKDDRRASLSMALGSYNSQHKIHKQQAIQALYSAGAGAGTGSNNSPPK